MTGPEDKPESRFERRGAPWAEDDYLEFVRCLRGGLTDGEVVASLGRTLHALRGRAQMMIGPDCNLVDALDVLRALLDADSDYDWRTPVQTAAAQKGWHFWTRADEEVLARGWVAATPMHELVARLELPESVIVRQLLGLRLASSTDEIQARIGTMPGGDLALRQALARERRAATVWCLVITVGLRRPQISVHGSRELAESVRDEALAEVDSSTKVQWWIAERTPSSGARGPMSGGTIEAAPKSGGATPAQRRWARGPRR